MLERNNYCWKEIISGYLKNDISFDIHCWHEEAEFIEIIKKYGSVKATDWEFGVVITGKITDAFTKMLLSFAKPTDSEIYNKMTPFFSIFLSNGFYSEHYGTEIHIEDDAETPFRCRCCNQKTFAVPPIYSIGYICPVCFWEDDVFITSDDEPSDCNHGLTLNEGRKNYKSFGAASRNMLIHVRKPKPEEHVK